MKAVSTPDSVPSLSEATRASSDTDDVSRNLFESHEHDYEEFNRVAALRNLQVGDAELDSIFVSDCSVTSFSPVDSPMRPVVESPLLDSPLELDYDVGVSGGETPLFGSPCYHGYGSFRLSAKQLVDMFNLRSKPSSTSGSDAQTTVTSNTSNLAQKVRDPPKVESLERECATLKGIIRADSTTILHLKCFLEDLREDATTKGLEIESVKKERELLRERESQHLETIRVLKKEIDALTGPAASSPEAHKELEQMRIENDLFATQIIENEVEMRECRSVLEYLDSENTQMRQELQSVQGKLVRSREDGSPEGTCSEERNLEKKVEALAARLDVLERERDQANELIKDSKRQRADELESIKSMILLGSLSRQEAPGKCEQECLAIVSDDGGIEVTIDGLVETSHNGEKEVGKDASKEASEEAAGSCDIFCDCFQSSHTEEQT